MPRPDLRVGGWRRSRGRRAPRATPAGSRAGGRLPLLASAHMLARDRDSRCGVGRAGDRPGHRARRPGRPRAGADRDRDRRRDGRPLRGPRPGPPRHRDRAASTACLGRCRPASADRRGCGELRRYDEAVPALVEGAAMRLSTSSSPPASTSWPGWRVAASTWASGTRPRRTPSTFSTARRQRPIARFVALNTLGWLRARRGDDDVWPLLDEALDDRHARPVNCSASGHAPSPEPRPLGWRARSTNTCHCSRRCWRWPKLPPPHRRR